MKPIVLLVEDDHLIGYTLQTTLSDAGFTVRLEHDGVAGWAAFQSGRPDVVVADIKMPGLDGFELLERIKRTDPRAEVILFTGYGDLASAKRAIELGADGLLEKLIDPDLRLVNMIKKAAEKRQLVRDRELIDRISRDLSSRLHLSDVLERFLDHIRNAFPQIDMALISLYDRERKRLVASHAFDVSSGQALVGAKARPGLSAIASFFAGDEPVKLGTKQPDGNAPGSVLLCLPTELLDLMSAHPNVGGLGVPIVGKERTIGNLTVLNLDSPDGFDDHLVSLLTTLCRQVGLYLENARLFADLQTQTGRLQAALNGSVDGMVLIDASGKAVMTNSRLQSFFGSEIGPESRAWQEFSALVQAGLATEEQARFVYTLDHSASDPPIIVEVHAARVHQDGASTGIVANLRDVTFLHNMDRRRTEILGEARHYVETPLDVISAYAKLLIQSGEPIAGDRLTETLRMMGQQAQEVKAMVKQTLQYSEVKEQLLTRQQGPLDLSALANELGRETAVLALQTGVAFTGEVEPGLWVMGNLTLKQAFRNLLENARKFTPAGGSIAWRVRRTGRHITAEIEDTGIGIPEDELDSIFKPYYRASSNTSRPGTGLGLSIARDVVDAHRGRIAVRSAEGKGSQFTVTLPAAAPPDEAA